MFETTLSQLEQAVAQLLEQNQALESRYAALEVQLQQAREENDTLQLSALEQEEQQGATLARLQALLQRTGVGEAA
jgi:cell division septum initiation protein DivIVA